MAGRDDETGPRRTAEGGWAPIPDPTRLTTEAVERATSIFHREIEALRDLHHRDLAAFRELLEARLAGMDQDRQRLWERSDDLVTRFTTALADFRVEVVRRDEANQQLIEQRLDDLDKAMVIAAEQIKAMPDTDRHHRERLCKDFHRELVAEREYHMAKLEVLTTRTEERFLAVDAGFAASKEAVAAALQAAKEAVQEQNRANSAAIKVSEGNTKEQLTALSQVSSANFKAQEDKITDARDRLTQMESLTRGIKEATGEEHAGKAENLGAATYEQTARLAEIARQRALVSSVIAAISVFVAIISVVLLVVLHKLGAGGHSPGPRTTQAKNPARHSSVRIRYPHPCLSGPK